MPPADPKEIARIEKKAKHGRKVSPPRPLNALEIVASRGAHLGTPLPRRLDKPGAKGSFALEQLAEADHDGRVRSRQRMLLSPCGAWAQSLAEAIHRADVEKKTVAQILERKLTPLDRVLGETISPEMRWYVDVNCTVLNGHKKSMDYSGSTRATSPDSKLPITEHDQADRRAFAFVRGKLVPSHQEFLEIATILQHHEAVDLTMHQPFFRDVPLTEMTIAEVGKVILHSVNAGRGEAGFLGYARAVGEALHLAIIEFSTLEVRRLRKVVDAENAERVKRTLGLDVKLSRTA
jgi:hypothetical protein